MGVIRLTIRILRLGCELLYVSLLAMSRTGVLRGEDESFRLRGGDFCMR